MSHNDASPTPLRYVACVSYPRSGHHLTVRLLSHYFKDAFRYCQYYNQSCDCCQSFPCTNPSVSMTKNHDMDLSRPLNTGIAKQPGVPYLVLIRSFLEAVVSDYSLFLRNHEDSREAWESFAQRKLQYYQRFLHKWVLRHDGLEKFVVRYERLTEDPLETFAEIINFFHPPQPVNRQHLQRLIDDAALEDAKPTGTEVIRQFGVRNRRRLEDFKHYDPQYFAVLELQLSSEMSQLGYPQRFAA
jgi:hypothetical protein